MKRLWAFFFVGVALLVQIDSAAAGQPVKIGVYNNAPLIFVDAQGRARGFFADIIEDVATKENWRVDYVPGTWEEGLERLDSRQIDLLSTIAFTPARAQRYDFTQESLITNWGQLYTASPSTIQAITDLEGKSVAVLKGDVHAAAFRRLLEQFGIPCQVIEKDDYFAVLETISEKRVDAGVVNRFFGSTHEREYAVARSGILFNPINIHYAVSKGQHRSLIAAIDQHVRLLKADEQSLYYQSLSRWFDGLLPKASFPAWSLWLLTAALVLILSFMVGNVVLRRKVRAKTQALKEKGEALQESERKYRLLVENQNDFVVQFTPDARLVYASPSFYATFGVDADGFKGVSLLSMVHEDDRAAIETSLARLREPPFRSQHEGRALTPSGWRWFECSARALPDADGGIGEIVSVGRDITDRKLAEAKLRESKERYRIIADFTYDWEYWLGPDATLEYISPACERITGYSPSAFFDDPGLMLSIVHEDDRAMVAVHLRVLGDRCPDCCNLDFRIVTADGQVKWINHYCMPVYSDRGDYLGRRASNRDITGRKLNEEKLKAGEQRFRELFDNMSSGVVIYDTPDQGEHFLIRDMNKAGLEQARKRKEEILGREVRDVFPGVEALGLFGIFRRVWRTGNPERLPISRYKDDRIDIWVENYVCKLPSGELVAIYEDMTAQRQAQADKEKLEHQIQQAQKLESIGVLAGGIAHDFNNILFPIVGLSEMLIEDLPAGSPEHENVVEIYQAAKRAGELVKQILSFSREARPQKLPTRFPPLLKEVIKLVRSTIPANIDITHRIQADIGLVMADPTQLHQVAMNLITNAYHAVEQCGGAIAVNLEETAVGMDRLPDLALEQGRYVRLTVTDTGCGIDPAVLGKIFEPYYTTKEQGKGTGLGLSVVYGIVKRHGGDIQVASDVGAGTTVDVYLPLLQRPAEEEPADCTATAATGNDRILLVDDEAPVLRLEERVLQRLGYHVTSVTSSIDALELFRRNPQRFDLVVTDMTMPNMTGDVLARSLLAIRADLPIVICTGFSEKLDSQKAEQLGIKGYLMKPVVRSELACAIRRALDGKWTSTVSPEADGDPRRSSTPRAS